MTVSPADDRPNEPLLSDARTPSVRGSAAMRPRVSASFSSSDSSGSELKQAISDLRNSHDLFGLLVDRVQDYAIFMLDHEGRVASWNEGARRIKGYTRAEILGRHFACFYTAPDVVADKPRQALEIAADAGRYSEEGLRLRKDGSAFWASVVITALYDDQQQLRGYAKVTQDITAVRHAQENSRLMVSLALNAMTLVDQQGTILSVNPQTEKLFGYSSAELIGQPIEMLVPERYRSTHPANRDRFFKAPVMRPMGAGRDLYGRRSDGSEFPVEIGLHPIETESGLQVLSSIVDITERKQAEDQARRYLNELAHVARLTTAGQMISELSHEMNQPLAAAANYSRACVTLARSNQGVTIEQLAEWMEKATTQINRTLDIVNRLASFVKNEGDRRAPINVNRVVENIVSIAVLGGAARQVAAQDAAPLLELDESLPMILADRVQIEQVLLNLIRNGFEAMQDVPAAKRKLVVRTSRSGDMLRVDVADNGQGIPADRLGNLFRPFTTTKPHGIGLGLSISHSIVEKHGGKFSVESKVGQGTTFTFTLPIPPAEGVI